MELISCGINIDAIDGERQNIQQTYGWRFYMHHNYLKNTGLEEAISSYIDHLKSSGALAKAERVRVKDSYGRITSEAVYAKISSPHYNACAMDGIAVCAGTTFGATDTTPVTLKEGVDFKRVDTGDPLPQKYDAVVMIEDVIEYEAGNVKLIGAAAPWQHVRQIGEDICAGEMIIASNTRIDGPSMGALIAGGILEINVWKKPCAGIIPTGDEIVAPSDNPGEGEIMEFNSVVFSSMLKEWGAEARVYDIVPDKYEILKDVLKKAAEECDIVIINAGSSAGREDYTSRIISDAGQLFLHGIAIRPGKPTILGSVNNKPVIGVPGYPVSGIIVMDMILRPVLDSLYNTCSSKGVDTEAILSRKIVSSLKYKEYVRVKLGYVGHKLVATPLNRGAGVITSFVRADGILEIPLNSEGHEAGEKVSISLLRSLNEIRNTVSVVGSHDLLVDIATDIMKRRNNGQYVSSAHVGSMGGIMAIKRGEAHLAGIHLLDEQTGEYNTSYLKKYFPEGNVKLIKCVKRIQGFMVGKGNPRNIKELKDIARKDIRYVNRQKGSGTRILFDYLMGREGLDKAGIYGYDREEFTHMSIAALVASGSADAGLGVHAAARAYDLDFIPVCEEEYDFIVPEEYLEIPAVRDFINILDSREFKAALDAVGGYILL